MEQPNSHHARLELAHLLETQHSQTSQMHGHMVRSASRPSDALLYALDVIRGGEPQDRTETLAALKHRIDGLVDLSSEEALRELAGHCVLLEELMVHYTVLAQTKPVIETRARLQKLAFMAQSAHARTIALIATINSQKQGRAKLVMHDGGEE